MVRFGAYRWQKVLGVHGRVAERPALYSKCLHCSEMAAKDFIAARLVKKMESEPLMRQFKTGAFARALFSANKMVKK
eukprot:2478889-Amphidinium_carterae.1